MCLRTLHDKVRNLGLGALYERHWGRGGFRDLFDDQSPDWASTSVAEKVVALRAFESAGVTADEIIANYRETLASQPGGERALGRLPAALRAYRAAGYAPRLTDDGAEAAASSSADRPH
jgi:hypothetical protein